MTQEVKNLIKQIKKSNARREMLTSPKEQKKFFKALAQKETRKATSRAKVWGPQKNTVTGQTFVFNHVAKVVIKF